MPTYKGKRVRGAIWINSRIKRFRTWRAQGSYSTKKGDRYFLLINVKTKTTRAYESPMAAMKAGWEKE